jgi:DNA-directed RNA polymerase subunit M/transcription elongation factor TFIIS
MADQNDQINKLAREHVSILMNLLNVKETIAKGILIGIKKYAVQSANDHPAYHDHVYPIYKSKLNDLIFNFKAKDDENPNESIISIIEEMKNGNLDAETIAFMTPQQLNEKKWSILVERINNSENAIKNLPTRKWKKCENCNKRRYFWRQEQIRSSDEPMTSIYTCKNCNREYRIN